MNEIMNWPNRARTISYVGFTKADFLKPFLVK